MKRIAFTSVLLLTAMLALGVLVTPSQCQTPTLQISPSSVTTYEGYHFTISIVIADVSDLYMWQVTLLFNASALRCTDVHLPQSPVVPIPPLPYGFLSTVDNGAGRIVASWWPPSPWPSFTGVGTLFQAEFEALNAGESDITFDPDNTWLYDSNGQLIPLADVGIFKCHVDVLDATHDIAVLDVEPFHNLAFKELPFIVHVTIANQGTVPESFNVSVSLNTTVCQTLTNAFLANESSTILDFTWDHLNLPEGPKYTASAYAWPVLGENETANNSFSDGMITIVHVGDVNGNGKIDIVDVAMSSAAFGSAKISDPYDPDYGKYRHASVCPTCPHTPNADLNCDAKVDIQDLSRTSANFGWHFP